MTRQEFLDKMSDLCTKYEDSNDIILGVYLEMDGKLDTVITHEWKGTEFHPVDYLAVKESHNGTKV